MAGVDWVRLSAGISAAEVGADCRPVAAVVRRAVHDVAGPVDGRGVLRIKDHRREVGVAVGDGGRPRGVRARRVELRRCLPAIG